MARGRVTRKRAPAPGEVVTSTLPPCPATRAATIARPRPVSAVDCGCVRSRPVEALEHPRGVFFGHARPFVGDRQIDRRHAGVFVDVGARRATVTGVPAGVCFSAFVTRFASTWRSRAFVADDHRRRVGRADLQRDGAVRDRSPARRGLRRVRARACRPGACSSGRSWSRRASSSRSSTSTPIRLASSSIRFIARPTSSALRHGALPVELGKSADRGQRRAQLVACIGDESAHPVLRAPRGGLGSAHLFFGASRRFLGCGPLSECALDLGEHRVQRTRKLADLGARVGVGYPAGQVAAGDPTRGAFDVAQRTQAGADDEVADAGENDEGCRADAEQQQHEPIDGVLHLAQALRDEQGAGRAV